MSKKQILTAGKLIKLLSKVNKDTKVWVGKTDRITYNVMPAHEVAIRDIGSINEKEIIISIESDKSR